MDVEIVVKDWGVKEKEDKSKTIAGSYAVRMLGKDVATQAFNSGYGSTDIPIPAKLMAKLEDIDAEIKQVIIENYTK